MVSLPRGVQLVGNAGDTLLDGGIFIDRLAVDAHAAAVLPVNAVRWRWNGGLACAVRADETVDAAVRHVQVQAVKFLDEIFDLDHEITPFLPVVFLR